MEIDAQVCPDFFYGQTQKVFFPAVKTIRSVVNPTRARSCFFPISSSLLVQPPIDPNPRGIYGPMLLFDGTGERQVPPIDSSPRGIYGSMLLFEETGRRKTGSRHPGFGGRRAPGLARYKRACYTVPVQVDYFGLSRTHVLREGILTEI